MARPTLNRYGDDCWEVIVHGTGALQRFENLFDLFTWIQENKRTVTHYTVQYHDKGEAL